MVYSNNPQDPTYWARTTAMYEELYGTPEEKKQERINRKLRSQSTVIKDGTKYANTNYVANPKSKSNDIVDNNFYSLNSNNNLQDSSLNKFTDLLKKLNSYKP